jgi:hypothetical protein
MACSERLLHQYKLTSPRQSPQRGEPPHGETALQEGLPPQATAFTEGVPKAYPFAQRLRQEKGAGSLTLLGEGK